MFFDLFEAGASLGSFSEPSEGFLEASWGLLRASWELLRAFWELGRRPWSFWGLRGGMLCALRRCLDGLAGRLDPSWDDFESFFEHFEISEADFGGRFWEHVWLAMTDNDISDHVDG